MPEPEDEAYTLIQSRPEGVLQSELWKELGVDSRKCSRIVKKLEESGLIDRVEFKKDGIKTYLLKAMAVRRSGDPESGPRLLRGDADEPRKARHPHHRRRCPVRPQTAPASLLPVRKSR